MSIDFLSRFPLFASVLLAAYDLVRSCLVEKLVSVVEKRCCRSQGAGEYGSSIGRDDAFAFGRQRTAKARTSAFQMWFGDLGASAGWLGYVHTLCVA